MRRAPEEHKSSYGRNARALAKCEVALALCHAVLAAGARRQRAYSDSTSVVHGPGRDPGANDRSGGATGVTSDEGLSPAMRSSEYAGAPFTEPRSHPWTDAAGDTRSRYYDLTASPAHIRSSLEDFLPWSRYTAIDDFYTLLEQLNRKSSVLESSDCAFTGPCANEEPSIPSAFLCSGRVIVLFRALHQNTERERVENLKNQLHNRLARLDPDFRWGMIGTTLIPARYLVLPGCGDQQLGSQLMISFWAWGETVQGNMTNLRRLFKNLALALRTLSACS
jgi:hypothetical protein